MIMVCGGAGYIGSHVVKDLTQRGFECVVVDNLSRGYREFVQWSPLEVGDIGDRAFLTHLFSKYPIDLIMHFAAFIEVGESVKDPYSFYLNNFHKTIQLLKVGMERNVKKFIFSSTAAVYGNPEYTPIDEHHACSPINPYGRSKWMVEQALQDFDRAYDLKSVTFRYFNASGATPDKSIGERHHPETHLIPLVLQTAAGDRESIMIFGDDYKTKDGTCIRDYIHVSDLADAHVKGVQYLLDNNPSNVFNLGNGAGFTVKEVIETARQITKHPIPAKVVQRREGDPAILVASADKAKSELQWTPQYTDLQSIIQSAWEWCQTDLYKQL